MAREDRWTKGRSRTRHTGPYRNFTATVALEKLPGNEAAYFSATGEERNLHITNGDPVVAAGCLHDEIVRYFPEFAPVVRVHLSDPDGTPMHAVENARYWLGLTKWQEYDREKLVSHLRCTEAEADLIHARVQEVPESEQAAAVEYELGQIGLRERWAAEAREAVAIIENEGGTER